MKNILLLTALILAVFTTKAQITGSAPIGEAGLFGSAQGGSPMLNLVMMEMRNKRSPQYVGEIVGSPYSTEKFIKSTIYYGDERQGDFFVRYNALNSVIEIKKTQLQDEEAKRLFADKRVRIKYLNKELRFTTYITKKGETKNGYLSLIFDGKNYKLYHKLSVKYSEGKAAANSMLNPIPSRFTHFVEYYMQKEGIDRIDQLAQKKGKFINQLDKIIRENVKLYIKENNINLDNEDDLMKIFKYINEI